MEHLVRFSQQSMSKLKNILFDFDGVLVNSLDIKTNAFYDMYLPYGEDVAEFVKEFHLQNGGVSRFEKFRLYHKKCLGIDIDDQTMNDLVADFSARVLEGVINCDEVQGAEAFLKKYAQKLNCFIITGTPTTEIAKILKGRNWDSYFVAAMGSPEKKTHWVSELIAKDSVSSVDSIFVGDAMADFEASVHGQMPFYLREHEENIPLFETIDCPRFTNFEEFEALLVANHLID